MSTESPVFTEIHNHLLPGVDDGSRSMPETLRHLQALHADGVRRLAFSPHLFGWLAEAEGALEARLDHLESVFRTVRAELAGVADVPSLELGQEVYLSAPEIADRVVRVPGVGHAGSRYVLMEFGFDLPEECPAIIRAVRDAGRRPIVAHPERYRRDGARVSVDEIASWKEAGALLQVNAGSLAGHYRSDVETVAWDLLARGLPDLIGSDNHADSRPESPAEADRLLRASGGDEAARILLHENPSRVLDDRETVAAPSVRRQFAA